MSRNELKYMVKRQWKELKVVESKQGVSVQLILNSNHWLQPVHIKYATGNWWALDIKSLLVPHNVCKCVCNWWGLERDVGGPPEEITAEVLQAQGKKQNKTKQKPYHGSCPAYCPLHHYMQPNYAWICNFTPSFLLSSTHTETHIHKY